MDNYLNRTIILASGSIRRKEIFEAHGHKPVIMPMDVDETLPEGIAPQDAVMYLSLKKGLACEDHLSEEHAPEQSGCGASSDESRAEQHTSALISNGPGREHALIVSADTIVYANDISTGVWTIMGKPKDEDDAWRMLSSIRGTSHKVMTGVALITPDPEDHIRRVFYDCTDVFVRDISDSDLKTYIDSGEPFGKAGGYAIQLEFGKFIDHIEGDYENVVGFPYDHMVRELESRCPRI